MSEDSGPRSLAVILGQINRGEFLAEANEELHELAKALEQHAAATAGKAKGTFTLKLTLTADGKTCTISPEVIVKSPKPLRGNAVFWFDRNSNLADRDPRQMDLPLREVPPPAGARDAKVKSEPARSV